MSFQGHLDGIAQGIEDARADSASKARLIVTCVRHFGVERGLAVPGACTRHPHPLHRLRDRGRRGRLPAGSSPGPSPSPSEAGLACTVHAGEAAGPESIRAALTTCRSAGSATASAPSRTPASSADRRGGIVLEVCPTRISARRSFGLCRPPAPPAARRRRRGHPEQRRPALFPDLDRAGIRRGETAFRLVRRRSPDRYRRRTGSGLHRRRNPHPPEMPASGRPAAQPQRAPVAPMNEDRRADVLHQQELAAAHVAAVGLDAAPGAGCAPPRCR